MFEKIAFGIFVIISATVVFGLHCNSGNLAVSIVHTECGNDTKYCSRLQLHSAANPEDGEDTIDSVVYNCDIDMPYANCELLGGNGLHNVEMTPMTGTLHCCDTDLCNVLEDDPPMDDDDDDEE